MADGLWFEGHAAMAKHPKTLKPARLLGVKRREAVGLLHDFFSWGLTRCREDCGRSYRSRIFGAGRGGVPAVRVSACPK